MRHKRENFAPLTHGRHGHRHFLIDAKKIEYIQLGDPDIWLKGSMMYYLDLPGKMSS